jgi:hypothetical protein
MAGGQRTGRVRHGHGLRGEHPPLPRAPGGLAPAAGGPGGDPVPSGRDRARRPGRGPAGHQPVPGDAPPVGLPAPGGIPPRSVPHLALPGGRCPHRAAPVPRARRGYGGGDLRERPPGAAPRRAAAGLPRLPRTGPPERLGPRRTGRGGTGRRAAPELPALYGPPVAPPPPPRRSLPGGADLARQRRVPRGAGPRAGFSRGPAPPGELRARARSGPAGLGGGHARRSGLLRCRPRPQPGGRGSRPPPPGRRCRGRAPAQRR